MSVQHEDSRPAVAGGRPVRAPERMLVFGAPAMTDDEIDAVVACLRSRWIGTGPRVQAFEQAFAAYKGAPHAVAVNSATAALHLTLLGLGVGPGDEVITTPMTFCATINAIIHTGATPVLADCDENSFNVSADAIERRITERTRAILVVHMCGRCCEMGPILELARANELLVVEDCAHAIESSWHGTPSGLMGDAGCFSFYVTKNMTTAEGGMVVTRDAALAAEIKTLALHGLSADAWRRFSDRGYRHYEVTRPGFKCNMTDISAALGLVQLARLEDRSLRRQEIWSEYQRRLVGLPCRLPPDPEPESRHALHLYTPLLALDRLSASRDQVLSAMHAEGIGVGVHYVPVHLHSYYREAFAWKPGDHPNAERIGNATLSLPLGSELTDADVNDVCLAFTRVLRYFSK